MNPEILADFQKWMKLIHPEKIQFNPTVIEIKDGKIFFGMYKHMGRLSVSIDKINLDLDKQKEQTTKNKLESFCYFNLY